MPTADLASSTDARELAAGDLHAAQLLWATIDSPWVHCANTDRYFETVRSLRDIDSDVVLSTHLPPATGIDSSGSTGSSWTKKSRAAINTSRNCAG